MRKVRGVIKGDSNTTAIAWARALFSRGEHVLSCKSRSCYPLWFCHSVVLPKPFPSSIHYSFLDPSCAPLFLSLNLSLSLSVCSRKPISVKNTLFFFLPLCSSDQESCYCRFKADGEEGYIIQGVSRLPTLSARRPLRTRFARNLA